MIGYILGALGVLGVFRIGSAMQERNAVDLITHLPPETLDKVLPPPPPPKPWWKDFLAGGSG